MKTIEIEYKDIPWWHSVPLNDGSVTPGINNTPLEERDHLFSDLDFNDKTVLDIGCWDGYYSFMAEKRGAKKVVALDDPKFRNQGDEGLAGFKWLQKHFESKVRFLRGSVFNLPSVQFDIVLCYGVVYHVNDPLTALINCFQVTKETLSFEGLLWLDQKPLLLLVDPFEINKSDPSNFYTMTTGYVAKIAVMNGFEVVNQCAVPFSGDLGQRGAMVFKRVQKNEVPKYPLVNYSRAPLIVGGK